MIRSRFRTAVTASILVLASCLFALGLVEFGVRIFVGTAVRYAYDENILYRPLPNQRGFPSKYYLERATINSIGMRGKEINSSADFRLLVVGDSHAFGVGLRDNETLSAQLEERLQQKYGQNIIVANGGVPGYGMYQITGLLKSQLKDLGPRVVILLYALPLLERQRPTVDIQAAYHRQMFLQRFAAYHLLKVLYIETLDRLHLQAYRLPTERNSQKLPEDTRFQTLWAIEKENFERLYSLTQQAQVPLVVIAHTPIKEDTTEYVREQLRRFCSEHAIPLFEYLRNFMDPAYYVPRDRHYSALFYKELVTEFFNKGFDQRILNRTGYNAPFKGSFSE
jgi:hypothetical protein